MSIGKDIEPCLSCPRGIDHLTTRALKFDNIFFKHRKPGHGLNLDFTNLA